MRPATIAGGSPSPSVTATTPRGKRATALRAPTSPHSPQTNSRPHRAEQPPWELRLAEHPPDDHVDRDVRPVRLAVLALGVELQLPLAALGVEREQLLAGRALDRAARALRLAEPDRALELAVGAHVVQEHRRVGPGEAEPEDVEADVQGLRVARAGLEVGAERRDREGRR